MGERNQEVTFNCSFVQKNPRKNKLEHNETGHLQEVSGHKTGNDRECIFLTFGTMLVFHRLKECG